MKQRSSFKDRRLRAEKRGKRFNMCCCHWCDWKGQFDTLAGKWEWKYKYQKPRRPTGSCPKCGRHAHWMELSEAQAMVLAP